MIGGWDHIFKTTLPYDEVEKGILDICREQWPAMVVEVDHTYRTEFFVYRSEKDKKDWDDLGCVDETANSMIYVIYDPETLTIVTDDPKEKTTAVLLTRIRQLLEPPKSSPDTSGTR